MSEDPDPYRDFPSPDDLIEELEAQQEMAQQPCWTIGRDAAGTWLSCRLELPEGGSIKINAPVLQAIRCMDLINENWVDAAKKAATA